MTRLQQTLVSIPCAVLLCLPLIHTANGQEKQDPKQTKKIHPKQEVGKIIIEGKNLPNKNALGGKARLMAAKKFDIEQTFAIHLNEIHETCQLNENQRQQLDAAAKVATESVAKQWYHDFPNHHMGNRMDQTPGWADDNPTDPEITDADQIDTNTVMYMNLQDSPPEHARDPIANEDWQHALDSTLNVVQKKKLVEHQRRQAEKLKSTEVDNVVRTVAIELMLNEQQTVELHQVMESFLSDKSSVASSTSLILPQLMVAQVSDEQIQSFLSAAQFQKWKIFKAPFHLVYDEQWMLTNEAKH